MGIYDDLKRWVQDLEDNLWRMTYDVDSAISRIYAWVKTQLAEGIAAIERTVRSWHASLRQTVTTWIERLTTKLADTYKTIHDWVQNNIHGLMKMIEDVKAKVYNWILDEAAPFWGKIKDWGAKLLAPVWTQLASWYNTLMGVYDSVRSWVEGKVTWLKEQIAAAVVTVRDWVTGLIAAVRKQIEFAVATIRSEIAAAYDKTVHLLNSTIFKLEERVYRSLGDITKTLEWFREKLKSVPWFQDLLLKALE